MVENCGRGRAGLYCRQLRRPGYTLWVTVGVLAGAGADVWLHRRAAGGGPKVRATAKRGAFRLLPGRWRNGTTDLYRARADAVIKERLTSDPRLSGVAVNGEISNFKHYPSGHMYFTLKDEHSRLRCVMFRRENMRLRFRPEDGQAVIARGDVSVYEAAGDYQLYVREMVPAGHGELALAFEQLKAKLAAEGLFDEVRKRPLPVLPRRIGVVTSLKGAALRDIISVTRPPVSEYADFVRAGRRPGRGGTRQRRRAIQLMNEHGGRGCAHRGPGRRQPGGPVDVQRRTGGPGHCGVAHPVISAVGHETDFTIADFVADKRAPDAVGRRRDGGAGKRGAAGPHLRGSTSGFTPACGAASNRAGPACDCWKAGRCWPGRRIAREHRQRVDDALGAGRAATCGSAGRALGGWRPRWEAGRA